MPDVKNKEAFKCALRMIKLWAKNRGIYSNAMGYLGGVSWAILVARTCQLYPNACASTIVHKFFRVLTKWEWPNPIMLRVFEDNALKMQVWDARLNEQDAMHKMPIITPAFPEQNTTYNVRKSTLSVMQDEFDRAFKICMLISCNKAEWMHLFESVNFFTKYKHYLVVEVDTETEHDLLEWQGLLESRIRFLIEKLETIRDYIDVACVYPYPISQEDQPTASPDQAKQVFKSSYFIGLQFRTHDIDLPLAEPIGQFLERVHENARKNKFKLTANIVAHYYKRVQLKEKFPNIDIKRKDSFSRLKKLYNTLFNSAASPHQSRKSPSPPNSNNPVVSSSTGSPRAPQDSLLTAGASPPRKHNGMDSPPLDLSMREESQPTDIPSNSQMDTNGEVGAQRDTKRRSESLSSSQPKRMRSESPTDALLTPELATPYERPPAPFNLDRKDIEIQLIRRVTTTSS